MTRLTWPEAEITHLRKQCSEVCSLGQFDRLIREHRRGVALDRSGTSVSDERQAASCATAEGPSLSTKSSSGREVLSSKMQYKAGHFIAVVAGW